MNKFLFLLLFVFQMNAQDNIVFPKVDAFKRNILEVSYGKPLGALSNKYDVAVTTSFFMRTKIANSQFVDFGLSLSGIVRGNSVSYQVGSESLVLDGSKTGLFLGFRYAVFLVQSKNENFHIESLTGLGWTYLHYSKPDDSIYEELDLKPTLHTIGISQGIKIVVHGFGLYCSYHYAPYDLFNSKIERSFGSSYLQFGISGSWNF